MITGGRLIARLDNLGDVVLAGPAVRALAADGTPVTFLAGPAGAEAAALLPGVSEVLTFDAAWVPYDARPLDPSAVHRLVADITARRITAAVVLTSFHQSPLPLALLLRMAGVPRIAATSVEYPGALLDHRLGYVGEWHEVEQSLAVCAAAGFELPAGDAGELRIRLPCTAGRPEAGDYVIVHPGASVPARGLPAEPATELVARLASAGHRVLVTGTPAEAARCRAIAGPAGEVRAERMALAELAALIDGARAVVAGNTGVVHLAAALGTPVVEAFAPTVPAARWRPWAVEHVLLGDQAIECAGCRSRACPVPGQPCLDGFTAAAAMAALDRVTARAAA